MSARRRLFLFSLLGLAATMPARAQLLGSPLPPAALEGLANTGAKTFDDYLGRCVLVEFFAYW